MIYIFPPNPQTKTADVLYYLKIRQKYLLAI